MQLRNIRLKQGLSKNKLGKLAGLSHTAITFIEDGKKSPTLDTLKRLAKALEVPISEIIAEEAEVLNKGNPEKSKDQL